MARKAAEPHLHKRNIGPVDLLETENESSCLRTQHLKRLRGTGTPKDRGAQATLSRAATRHLHRRGVSRCGPLETEHKTSCQDKWHYRSKGTHD